MKKIRTFLEYCSVGSVGALAILLIGILIGAAHILGLENIQNAGIAGLGFAGLSLLIFLAETGGIKQATNECRRPLNDGESDELLILLMLATTTAMFAEACNPLEFGGAAILVGMVATNRFVTRASKRLTITAKRKRLAKSG